MDRLLFLEIFSFFVIAIILAGALYVLRGKRKSIFFKNSNIEEIERFYYMPKVFISIVKIGEKYFMLGVTENSINKLEEILNMDEIEELKKVSSKNEIGTKFSRFFSERKDNNVENLKSRLKKMRHEDEE
ncbi:flagellar biosynthetic protein FliO [Haliovirga abyssi]|uniref:Flagellar protein n=1 Tax=Haliovirga abyssi TaxID=2996794 RepID=A0AAU9D6E6_9FUSO|nr:flagellar biosynthetic protein FliO [Haliovirga abyssi]BDU50118.1 hypothetical protein HLVA_06870 [Haliovirga abyssi]